MTGSVQVATNAASGKTASIPMTAESLQVYYEQLTRDSDNLSIAARRQYLEATSSGSIQQTKNNLRLRDESKELIVRLHQGRTVTYGENVQLSHSELELLRTPLVSIHLERVLPTTPVKQGETWQLTPASMSSLFDLNTVDRAEVSGRLASFDNGQAKLEFTGSLDGMIDGVSTKLNFAAKALYDRQQRVITWMAMSLNEKRMTGKAEPGFDVSAQIRMLRKPVTGDEVSFPSQPLVLSEPIPPARLMAELRGGAGFTALGDRSWKIVSDSPKLTVLRMVRQDKVIGQCEFRSLAKFNAGEQLTLEAFQEDVRTALGKQFGEFLNAEEQASELGVRTIRCTVAGVVQEVPVLWSYQHFSDDHGRRIAATCTLDAKNVEEFAQADAQLAASFQFKSSESPTSNPEATKQATINGQSLR